LPAAGGAEPLAAVLAVQALCCLEALAATGLCVELEDVHHASIERMPAAGRVRLALRLLAGGTVGRAEVEAPAGGAVPEARGRRPVWVDLLPVEIVAVLGRGRIPAGQLRALGVGDAVTFDEAPEGAGGGGPGGAVWIESAAGAARGPRWNGRCDGDGVVLGAPAPLPRAPGRMAMDGEGSGSDRTEVVPQPEGARLSVDDVPIEVTAVAGRATLAVRDLAALGPGSVVGLGRGSGGAIDLLANGVPFGRGRLVDLEGELAVEVTEIRAGALPATGRSS
jgi:flagellar motor switch/type III secretory pathway protein FliN